MNKPPESGSAPRTVRPSERWLIAGLPFAAAALGGILLLVWLLPGSRLHLQPRLPGTDQAPDGAGGSNANPVLVGKVVAGPGKVSDLPGAWPGFRGPVRTGISPDARALARNWGSGGPHSIWSVEVGEGYAGPAVAHSRVYLVDYDRDKKQDAVRCLSLADGKETWRFAYPVAVKRNHGMTRTVPTVTDKQVVSMGPKCHVACLDAFTGELRWGMDLVRQFGATIPPWYAGQCPLVDGGVVILAPGGNEALLLAADLATGNVLWKTPNPKGWKMTHSSVALLQLGGERIYLYCASGGIAAVSAKDGQLLWDTAEWKISIATVPSPLILEEGRVFLSGGYNAGSLMLQFEWASGKLTAKTLFKLDPEVFGATQHTPIYFNQHIYGVRPDGQFVCLDRDGKPLWASGPNQPFNLGSFLLADGLIYALNDSGNLSLIEASSASFNRLAQAQVLHGRESWGPMALAGTRLLVRDLTQMVCLEVGGH